MNRDEKRKHIKKILEVVENIVNKGIDEEMTGDLFPHEMIYLTLRTIIESTTMQVAVDMATETDIHKKLYRIEEVIMDLESKLDSTKMAKVIYFPSQKSKVDN